jgi:hypothetical protein
MWIYEEYLSYLKGSEKGQLLMERHALKFGNFPEQFEECPFYGYLSFFKPLSFKKPRGLTKLFNWKMFFCLLAAAPDNDYQLEFSKEGILPELMYYGKISTDEFEVATISQLNLEQALRLAFECFDQLFTHLTISPDGRASYNWNQDPIGGRYGKYLAIAAGYQGERHKRLLGKRGGKRKGFLKPLPKRIAQDLLPFARALDDSE